MTIGERIKALRLERHKTADEVAEALGKNRATVYRYESNEIENLPAKVLTPLAEILETTPAYLMGWTDDPYDYDNDPNSLLDTIPTQWVDASREEGISNVEIWRRYSMMQDDAAEAENKKSPDTFIDVEGLSSDVRKLVDYARSLSDEEARELLAFAKIYHAKKQ